MHIQELSLQTRHLANQKAFYHTILGLPLLLETTDSFTIQAGKTQLRFQETKTDVLYHVAFSIPHTSFREAKEWVHERIPLLAIIGSQQAYASTSPLRMWNKESEDEVFFPIINARSFYCRDAANNILKFIAYNNEAAETNGMASVLSVSEIGLPVEDVRALATQLQEQLGIEPYPVSRPASEDFAYLGDIFGQLVVVKIGHPWLPTQTVKAMVAPVHLTIRGQQKRHLQLPPYPYTITVATS